MLIPFSVLKKLHGDEGEQILLDFFGKSITEHRHVDYKIAMSGGDDKDKQNAELLRDVTSFANAEGGDIFIGVSEPNQNSDPKDLLIGVCDGEKLRRHLENICVSSIDPRISGLEIILVNISNGKKGDHVIVVHIPPSMNKPHMVSSQKLGIHEFYIRHSEGKGLMSTHEVREAVLSSATAEGHALKYLKREQKKHIKETTFELSSYFLLQVMPLIKPTTDIDIFDRKLASILLDGSVGHDTNLGAYFRSHGSETPAIYGLDWSYDNWKCELHRFGYMCAAFALTIDKNKQKPVVGKGAANKISAFFNMCENIVSVTNHDVPYVIQCQLFNPRGSILLCDAEFEDYSEPYERDEMVWPLEMKNTGENFSIVSEKIRGLLSQAYGIKPNRCNL